MRAQLLMKLSAVLGGAKMGSWRPAASAQGAEQLSAACSMSSAGVKLLPLHLLSKNCSQTDFSIRERFSTGRVLLSACAEALLWRKLLLLLLLSAACRGHSTTQAMLHVQATVTTGINAYMLLSFKRA